MSATVTRIVVSLNNGYRRMLAVFLRAIGPRASYALLAVLARCLYGLHDPLRLHCEMQCQAALGKTRSAEEVTEIARQSFVNRAWNLADLMLAGRLIRRETYQRYGGRIPEPDLAMLRSAQANRHPVILVTAYYGPYDLLPLLLGYNGIRAGVVYRPHANPSYDAYRQSVRARSGCEMIPDTQAVSRLPEMLEAGRVVAILADHHAGRRGIPVSYLGLETTASRSVGLLATHFKAAIVVAGIRRLDDAFRFEMVVADRFEPTAWCDEDDPMVYITQRYIRALETIVLAEPRQYLWAHPRWG